MEIIFEHYHTKKPTVSIVLLDWSVRESFHILHYLNNQTVSREQYEIIWIEYYDRRASQIESKLKRSIELNQHPILDKWIVMDTSRNIYYHKHLMYNVGIVVSSGHIIVICDSDAICTSTFIESVIKSFEKDSNIVLHLDEVRNTSKRFYPFNYPSIEEILAEGVINWCGGKPRGIVDKSDPLHLPNYGACMCALRDDLISIGGADEHLDYLGHICGPYEMTFRLVNAGKREVWHDKEWLYHVWHPGQDGDANFSGPSDGFNMSTTALDVRKTRRIQPLVENPAINMLRLKQSDSVFYASPVSVVIPKLEMENWTIEKRKWKKKVYWNGSDQIIMKEWVSDESDTMFTPHKQKLITKFHILKILFKMLLKQIYTKLTMDPPLPIKSIKTRIVAGRNPNPSQSHIPIQNIQGQANGGRKFLPYKIVTMPFIGVQKIWRFSHRMLIYNRFLINECRNCIHRLVLEGIKEVAVYGTNDFTIILYILMKSLPIKITATYNGINKKRFLGFDVKPIESLNGYQGKIIIASFVGIAEKVEKLKELGINTERIITLGYETY